MTTPPSIGGPTAGYLRDLLAPELYDRLAREGALPDEIVREECARLRHELAAIATYKAEDIPGQARRMGDLLMARLRAELAGRAVVREIRGLGLLVGIELREKVAPYLKALMVEHGVIALPAGPQVLRLLPPLIINEDEIEIAVRAVAGVLPR